MLCMRERASASIVEASFLCCDVSMLEAGFSATSGASRGAPQAETDKRGAIALMCSVAAASGCDFTSSKGLDGSRFDHFWEALPAYIASVPATCAEFDGLCTGEGAPSDIVETLRLVCEFTSDAMRNKKRFKRQAEDMSRPCVALLRRALWSTASGRSASTGPTRPGGLTTREREGARGATWTGRVALRLVEPERTAFRTELCRGHASCTVFVRRRSRPYRLRASTEAHSREG